MEILSIRLSFTFILKESVLTCFLVIKICFVLEIFSEGVFAINQSVTSATSRLTRFCHFTKLLPL